LRFRADCEICEESQNLTAPPENIGLTATSIFVKYGPEVLGQCVMIPGFQTLVTQNDRHDEQSTASLFDVR